MQRAKCRPTECDLQPCSVLIAAFAHVYVLVFLQDQLATEMYKLSSDELQNSYFLLNVSDRHLTNLSHYKHYRDFVCVFQLVRAQADYHRQALNHLEKIIPEMEQITR